MTSFSKTPDCKALARDKDVMIMFTPRTLHRTVAGDYAVLAR